MYLCRQILLATDYMKDRIEHAGVVCGVVAGRVSVRIQQTSACAHCKVAGTCLTSRDQTSKVVEVACQDASAYKEGEPVTVSATTAMAAGALLYAFGLPFLLMIAVLVAVLVATGSEPAAALAALASLVPYYTLLYICRAKLGRTIRFEINKQY